MTRLKDTPLYVLGIESSCDETAAAVVRNCVGVRSNVVASQYELHASFGGVVPEVASRAHAERLTPVLRAALEQAGIRADELGAVAVANRPGLIGSLLVGVSAAKGLAWSLGIPLVGVDHVRAHLVAGLLQAVKPGAEAPPIPDIAALYPALGLVVSGGHSSIYFCASPLSMERLGSTIDDAVGEAYDKCAAILGLPHPGGPNVDALAKQGNDRAFDFPISRLGAGSLDFSFSGLKTAVLYAVRGQPVAPRSAGGGPTGAGQRWERDASSLSEQARADVCASFQRAAVGAIIFKLRAALARVREEGRPVRTLLVGGGVSANSRLRAELDMLARSEETTLILPRMEYCMDNAAMIAAYGALRLAAGERDSLALAASPSGTA